MNGIIGMTELALETEPHQRAAGISEYGQNVADSLLSGGERHSGLLENRGWRMELDCTFFACVRTWKEPYGTFGVRAGEKGVELVCDIRADVPQAVAGDPARLDKWW